MAKRYSGNATISITYLDSKGVYKAIVHAGGDKRTIYVGAARVISSGRRLSGGVRRRRQGGRLVRRGRGTGRLPRNRSPISLS